MDKSSRGALPSSNQWIAETNGRASDRFTAFAFASLWAFLGLYDTGLLVGVPGKALVRIVGIGILLCVVALRASTNRGNLPNIRSAFLLCLIVGVMSSLAGVSMPLGLLKLALYACIVIPTVYYSGVGNLIASESRQRRLVFGVALLFLAVGLYRGVSPAAVEIGNTNYVSSLSLCALPVILIGQITQKTVLSRFIMKSAVWAVVVVCILNHSRGALLGVGAMLCLWQALKDRPDFGRCITLLVFFAAVAAAGYYLFDNVRDFAMKGQEKFLDGARENEFALFAKYGLERPILGYGFGLSWRVEPWHFEKVMENGRMSWYIGEFGNSTLAMLAGGGVALLSASVLLGICAFSSVANAMKLEYRVYGASVGYRTLVALFCGVVGFLVHSQSEGWLMSPATLPTFTFWTYFGAMLCVAQKARDRTRIGFN